jgi:hypothetical protein
VGAFRLAVLAALLALLATASPAMAQPPPPPNPSDQELDASQDAVVTRAAELGRLSGVVAELDRQAAEVRTALADQREAAFQRLLELRAADEAAAEAASRVEGARVETAAAASAIDWAQGRLDEFATSTYQQNLDLGPLGLLTSATSPADLVARAELTDLVAQEQLRALDALLRANTARVNAESTARAAEEDARARQEAAEQARVAADGAVAATAAAVADHEARLRELDDRRAGVEAELAAVRTADQGLREQRESYDVYQRRAAEQAEEERRRAAQAAAADPPDPGPSRVDPVVSGLGPQYECRAGVPRWGPVKPWVSEAGQLLRCRFGIGSVGGVGARKNASDHPAGLALDFFVDRPTGDALADCAIRNRESLAVKYVIFRQRINNGSGWRQMEDRGSPVANHMEHVHISFNTRPGGSPGSVSC